MNPTPTHLPEDAWRTTHLGCLLGNALRRFDARVLQLIASAPDLPLKLANYAARGLVTAAQIHLTRHLPLRGSRLTDMAATAGMTKQAMAALVAQCEAMGLVVRESDPGDARARTVRWGPSGLLWHAAFRDAVAQAEGELRAELGAEVATVLALALEAYGSSAPALTEVKSTARRHPSARSPHLK